MDLLRDFGTMTFASRLKRLGDRLKAEATRLYNARGVEFNDSWFLVAFLLSRNEGLSVTDMADMLGISRAAVSQMYKAMERNGLLVVHTDDRDKRRRLLYLTEEGRAAVTALEPIWNAVGKCTEDLVRETGQDVLKALSDIEPLRLQAEEVDGGFIVNGVLPWVSNLGDDHYFGTMFQINGKNPRKAMALIPCQSEGFTLRTVGPFTALEGTRTLACQFKDVFVPESMLIADPIDDYLPKIRAGFILLQMGMGVGNIQSCINLMNEVEPQLGHVNRFLDDRPDELQEELNDAIDATTALAEEPLNDDPDFWREVLELRLAGGELALRAANSAMLHTGAKGYLQMNAAQRKLREAYFIAIVTPATKHLRKELSEM